MAQSLRALHVAAGRLVVFMALFAAVAKGDTVTLKNGMILDGSPSTIGSVSADPLKGVGNTDLKQILLVDNQLSRTFVPTRQLAKEFGKSPAVGQERIPLFQRIPASGQVISVVGAPGRVYPFDEYGRRIFEMEGPRNRTIELVQGITEITPKWTKVEAIEGINHYIWTMKIATSSIPREQLSRMINRALDPQNPDQRVRIVRLYLQSERFKDARVELEQLIKDFPGLEHLNGMVKELRQLAAQQLLKEIELRKNAGQYRFASLLLENFPADGVAGETLLKVREMLDELQTQQQQGAKTLKLIEANLVGVRNEAAKKQAEPIVAEIKNELNINNLDRFADFLRLADDNKMLAEQKLALAVSGWLMGSGEAIDNLETSLSLVTAREVAQKYMATTRKPDRDNLLAAFPSEVSIGHIAKIIAHMKPPIETSVVPPAGADVGNPAAVLGLQAEESKKPSQENAAGQKPAEPKPAPKDDNSGSCAPKDKDDDSALLKTAPKPVVVEPKDEPPAPQNKPVEAVAATAQATEIPGLYKLIVTTNLTEDPIINYWVQTPPEYDPYRRYPCIVTLHGAGQAPPEGRARAQIDWWAGGYDKTTNTRPLGHATRNGYIVIAPEWSREHQRQYEWSAREHAAVLLPLRDACKRFAIDVDRVFLTGHSMGGTAAWDVGLSHPDLWAGLIPIVATPGRYISQYWENGKYVPMYFVCGEKDSFKYACGTDWDKYLTKSGYENDVTIVEYLGRGHEWFFDEIQNLFTWMGLHKRDFFPKKFTVQSLRPWDNFFWWVETGDPLEVSTILPAEWGENPKPAKTPRAAETKTSMLAPNGVRVASGSCGKLRVWLSPELVTFDNSLKVDLNGKVQRKVQPKVETLLEDVRTRGDRQHPFWAKVELRGTTISAE
jgi:predicted esterase